MLVQYVENELRCIWLGLLSQPESPHPFRGWEFGSSGFEGDVKPCPFSAGIRDREAEAYAHVVAEPRSIEVHLPFDDEVRSLEDVARLELPLRHLVVATRTLLGFDKLTKAAWWASLEWPPTDDWLTLGFGVPSILRVF